MIKGARAQLAFLGSAAVEMRIARSCVGARKFQHLLRLHGEALAPVLDEADDCVDLALRRAIV
eukprot:2737625-Lingulodinium_polyedra.AAC.1